MGIISIIIEFLGEIFVSKLDDDKNKSYIWLWILAVVLIVVTLYFLYCDE